MEINSQPSFFSLLNPLCAYQTIHRHRGLLWQFTKRNVELRHRGSFLGILWAVLNPLLMLALYVFVFGYIFEGAFHAIPNETKWDYGLGIFLGISIFHFVSESISSAPQIVVGNPNFVKKVVFPLEILPAAAVSAAAIHLGLSLCMILVGTLFSSQGLSTDVLLLPVVLPPMILFSLGCAWLISALGVFFRDIGQLVGMLSMGLLFASGVFYPADKVRAIPNAWMVLRFNPVIHAVEIARDTVLWHRPISVETVVWLYALGFGTAILGFAVFGRLKRTFADVL